MRPKVLPFTTEVRARKAWFKKTLHDDDSLGKGKGETRVIFMAGFELMTRV